VRILIVRTSALGDVVHALPVLTALRRHLPEAHIGWVIEESLAPLLAGHPDLDEVLEVALRRWAAHPLAARTRRESLAFVRKLRRFAPSLAIDLMGNHKAGALAWLSGSAQRLGAVRRQRREPSSALWIGSRVATSGPHAVDHGLSLLAALDIPRETADFGGPRLLPDVAPLGTPQPFALIHPGAGWGNKRYPPAWWGEVARRFRAAGGPAVRVAVAPGEEALADAVVAAAGPAATLEPAPDLPSLVALLRGARLVFGGDTGPLHLAHALGTPVLMLLGPTDPERNGPYGAPERALARRLPCSFCYRRFTEVKACLLEIPPRRVAEHALSQLATTPPAAGGSL
jgi:heptosyltransferase-1